MMNNMNTKKRTCSIAFLELDDLPPPLCNDDIQLMDAPVAKRPKIISRDLDTEHTYNTYDAPATVHQHDNDFETFQDIFQSIDNEDQWSQEDDILEKILQECEQKEVEKPGHTPCLPKTEPHCSPARAFNQNKNIWKIDRDWAIQRSLDAIPAEELVALNAYSSLFLDTEEDEEEARFRLRRAEYEREQQLKVEAETRLFKFAVARARARCGNELELRMEAKAAMKVENRRIRKEKRLAEKEKNRSAIMI